MPFDRTHVISYYYFTVTISLSCTVSEILHLFPKISRGHATLNAPPQSLAVAVAEIF